MSIAKIDAAMQALNALFVTAEKTAREDAAKRIVAACGCQTEHGCEVLTPTEDGEIDSGCARFVRAVRGEGA